MSSLEDLLTVTLDLFVVVGVAFVVVVAVFFSLFFLYLLSLL